MTVATTLFLLSLCLLPVLVEVQIMTDCVPYHNCLTCYVYRFHCNNCTKGHYLTRGGAYYTCKKCPSRCEDCRNRFSCDTCKLGYWGDSCQEDCSHGCLESVCLKKTGICQPEMCKPGFRGTKCNRCIRGKYGRNCNITRPFLDRRKPFSVDRPDPESLV